MLRVPSAANPHGTWICSPATLQKISTACELILRVCSQDCFCHWIGRRFNMESTSSSRFNSTSIDFGFEICVVEKKEVTCQLLKLTMEVNGKMKIRSKSASQTILMQTWCGSVKKKNTSKISAKKDSSQNPHSTLQKLYLKSTWKGAEFRSSFLADPALKFSVS